MELSSSELVNTSWWLVRLQFLYLQGEDSAWCSGGVGDQQKFAGLKESSSTMETL